MLNLRQQRFHGAGAWFGVQNLQRNHSPDAWLWATKPLHRLEGVLKYAGR